MNSRIYLTREKHFLQISDEFLANKILTDYKDIIDLIAGSPNEIYYHTGHPRIPTQGDKLYTTNFHAETHQFHKIDEISCLVRSFVIVRSNFRLFAQVVDVKNCT